MSKVSMMGTITCRDGKADEMALAAELLEISNEAELDQFLGSIFKKVSSAVGKAVKSPIGPVVRVTETMPC